MVIQYSHCEKEHHYDEHYLGWNSITDIECYSILGAEEEEQMSQKQELHLQQMATRSRAEVEEELEIMAEILPASEDSKKLLTMLFIELHHWLFADKADEHPKPSELLLQILTNAKDDFGPSGAGPKKPIKYDA